MWSFLRRRPSYEDLRLGLAVERTAKAHLATQWNEAREQAAYWRTRAERLIDAGLAHRGEITAPVMEVSAPRTRDPVSTMLSAIGVTEIGTHSPPGQAAS